jgi:NHL repeat
VAIAPDGSVYISDQGQSGNCIRKVGTDGNIHTFAGQCGSGGGFSDERAATSAQLYLPSGIALGQDGSLYIADSYNNRIRRVDPSGTIHTVAGSGPFGPNTGGFSGDAPGPATQAVMDVPTSVDVTADGTLYILDSNNRRIRPSSGQTAS